MTFYDRLGWILAQIVVADKIFILSVSFYSRNTIQYGNQYGIFICRYWSPYYIKYLSSSETLNMSSPRGTDLSSNSGKAGPTSGHITQW